MITTTTATTTTTTAAPADLDVHSAALAQPCTVACSIGTYETFLSAGLKPLFAAGHSLGELPALHAAGLLSRKEMCELVCKRAKAMAKAVDAAKPAGAPMAAVLGPAGQVAPAVERAVAAAQCKGRRVWVANYNSPSQVVITGEPAAVADCSAAAADDIERKTNGKTKIVPLRVAGAFHSEYMRPAARAFNAAVSACSLGQTKETTTATTTSSPPTLPVAFSNVTGKPYPAGDAQACGALLRSQMESAVRFTDQVEGMHRAGARVFVEFGPRRTLSKLVEQTLGAVPGAGKVGLDYDCISVNPDGPKRCSELQLREAAVALVVAGVPLSRGFDAWDASRCQHNAFATAKDKRWHEAELIAAGKMKKKRKMELQLSAATYVSNRTLKARAKAIEGDDGTTHRAKAPISTPGRAVARSLPPRAPAVTSTSHSKALPANALRGNPGAPQRVTWHPLAGINGNPTPSFQPSAYPPREIAFIPFPGNANDNEHTPGVLPLSWYNMCEFMCGRVSECLGEEFKVG